MKENTNSGAGADLRRFLKITLSSHIFEGAATLSYYLLFSLFPFLMLLSASVSMLRLQGPLVSGRMLGKVIPDNVVALIRGYLNDMEDHSWPWIILGIVLTVYSTGKAVESLKRRLRVAYRSDPHLNVAVEWLTSLVFVLLMLAALFATLVLVVAGEHFFSFLQQVSLLSERTGTVLHQLRLLPVGALVFFLLFGIYYVLPASGQRVGEALPGTIFAMISWIFSSWLFSYYVDHLNDFSALYGSLGTIIVLMVWLYLFNLILLLGGQINAYLYRKRREVDL